ncbi:DNA polymerase III subunit chi [Nitrococcus mobilis]|uniref:DNA polymerase III subunit chi n=1 Tax=Nitrococcus mobilis Nb-231 TaxID=314278 RepID=A4BLM8_9GAMM|nr:DNA polymerase III subunit chi [Nitrococcus mobilis]EAR23216.1 DNA polymerase III subunit chi [Nitrococcus mobilis Nb-231]
MAQTPRIDFYVLTTVAAAARELFCCRLTEKAYRQGYRVFILTGDKALTQALDLQLWTFRAGSFVPHATLGQADDEPVVLGEQPPRLAVDLLINLAAHCPNHWQRLSRIAEIVTQQPESLELARERFRCYRNDGAQPTYHRLAPP